MHSEPRLPEADQAILPEPAGSYPSPDDRPYHDRVSSLSPTGRQIHLTRDGVSAQIAQVGASLRGLAVGDVDLISRYPEDIPTPSCSGVVLAPWPNRIRDGVWRDGDEASSTLQRLAITEPKLHNASHGLLRFTAYEIEEADAAATLRATIHPQTGYPYEIATSVTYTLTDAGIQVTHALTNRSDAPAPVALGTHPFVTIGDVDPRDLVLRVPAANQFETDERMLPIETVPAPEELRTGVRLGDITLDTGFTDLARGDDGRVRHSLTAPDGRRLTLWQGEGFDFVQVYTTAAYPGQQLAVAIEPMTAPADAFNSRLGLRRLATGETWTVSWGIELA